MKHFWKRCGAPPRSPIEFEPMAADTDGYFSSDQQRIAIREGMSEVQTVSAAVHEVAHSKLHDPKKQEAEPSWKIVMVSDGGTERDFHQGFATQAEAEQAAAGESWRYIDENRFEWRLEVKEDCRRSNRLLRTSARKKSRRKAFPTRSASILASDRGKQLRLHCQLEQRQRPKRAEGQSGNHQQDFL